MRAKRMGQALLWSLVCVAVGCSSKPAEPPPPLASRTAPLAVGWEGTGSMAGGRKLHAGVLLPSGKVLVTGGSQGATLLAAATIYEPGTGAWPSSWVTQLPEARQAHTLTVLDTGKVLVAGGEGSGFPVSTPLYDPDTNTWSSKASLAQGRGRGYLTATKLLDGRVLVAGGLSNGAQDKVDVYEPVAETWAVGPTMKTPRRSHTATRLANGKVLVVGGWSGGVTGTAELYDPGTNTWKETGALITGRYDHTATLLPNGKVLVVGGRNGSQVVASAELYDLDTGTWIATGTLGVAREFHTATLLNTGRVLVAGGKSGSGSALGSAEVYDPATGQWNATPPMGGARFQHVAVSLGAVDKVLVAGGVGPSSLATAELYEYDSNPCAGVICNTPPGACFDAPGTCNNGACTYLPKASGASCDDTDACTGGDACDGAGECVGSPASCTTPPGQCYEAAGTCSGGACDYTYKAAGASCDDGDACTLSEVCNGAGGCAGTPVSCTTPPGQCYEAAGTCSGGTCSYAPKAAGSTCDDGSAGTLNDVCNGAGACAGVTACTTPPSACHDLPGTWANGACTYPFKGAGTLCDDADACTTGDECNGAGACGGTAVVCNSPPNSCYSAAGVCGNGTCTYTPEPAGVACASDSDACTQDVCDGAGACSHPLSSAGTSCGSGQICDATGQCLSGCWIAGTYYAAGASNPSGDCQQCNPSVSTSSWSFKPATTQCRASAGTCDVAEYCTGTAAACPANGYTTNGTSCGTSYGSWSTCGGFSDYCDTTGTQSRSVTASTCGAGTCSASNTSTETQACTRAAPNTSCSSPRYGSWSACSFSDECAETGTRERTVTSYGYDCATGQCESETWTEEAECGARNTDGDSCDSPTYMSWSQCWSMGDFCSSQGERYRGVIHYTCGGGTCSGWSHETEIQSCSRTPLSCSGPTYGQWTACSFSNACAATGTQLRSITTFNPNCSTGNCDPSYSPEVRECTRTPPTLQCPATSYGAWSSCTVNPCGQGTRQRTVTSYTPDTAACQCVPQETIQEEPCTGTADPSYAVCNGACIDISNDDLNCGSCGRVCPFKWPFCAEKQCHDPGGNPL